ncbi:MAG TPA: SurA N-terminal domain-containing protein [Pseudogracilibacillus sp.]|nr:SurA N-terminal domain-containing protein [Pseudogracilibacillus sp.]
MKKYISGLSILLVAIFLVACGDNNEENASNEAAPEQEAEQVEISDDEKVPDDDVVAVINDEDVEGETYNIIYAQLKSFATQSDQDVDQKEIQELTMDSLIDRIVLLQYAKDEGIEVSEEEAEDEIDTIKSENEDNYKNILDQFQMSEDGFKEQLRFELTLDKFKEKKIDEEVSDEEVQEAYDELAEENEDVPELDEVEDQLKTNLLDQKTNEALQKKIDKVKEDAEIDEKLDA